MLLLSTVTGYKAIDILPSRSNSFLLLIIIITIILIFFSTRLILKSSPASASYCTLVSQAEDHSIHVQAPFSTQYTKSSAARCSLVHSTTMASPTCPRGCGTRMTSIQVGFPPQPVRVRLSCGACGYRIVEWNGAVGRGQDGTLWHWAGHAWVPGN
ncbi:hypothetical protein VTK56DRAFT_2382 [Thermocarpiscus australiensis]